MKDSETAARVPNSNGQPPSKKSNTAADVQAEETSPLEPVPLLQLFSGGDHWDNVALGVGLFACVVNGCAFPVFTILVGQVCSSSDEHLSHMLIYHRNTGMVYVS